MSRSTLSIDDSHFVSHSFITFNNLFKLITNIMLSNSFFLIYQLNRHKIQVRVCLGAEVFE